MELECTDIIIAFAVSLILIAAAIFLNRIIKNKMSIKKHLKIIIASIFSFFVIFIVILSIIGFMKVFGYKSELSSNMQDWGAYAACLTAAFSALSIGGIYWTYRTQVKTSRMSSFDTLFSQILNNHNALYEKVIKDNPYIFQDMVKCFVKYFNIDHDKGLCKKLRDNNYESCKLKEKRLNNKHKPTNTLSSDDSCINRTRIKNMKSQNFMTRMRVV